MNNPRETQVRSLLAAVKERIPPGLRFAQEAFTMDHHHRVLVKIGDISPNTFYYFDEVTVQAFSDAVITSATRSNKSQVIVNYPSAAEFQSQYKKLSHLAAKLGSVKALSTGIFRSRSSLPGRMEYHNTAKTCLAKYRITLVEGLHPIVFICRDVKSSNPKPNPQSLGFFSFESDFVANIADDVDQVVSGMGTRITTFEKLQLLHKTTQRIARDLESYSKRIDLVVKRARRRPDLLTAARFNRIVGESITKIEHLKKMSRRALRTIDRIQM